MKSYIKNITRVATLGLTTSIAAICMSNQAEAATIDYTYQTNTTERNDNYNAGGFQLSLNSTLLKPSGTSPTVTTNTSVTLSQMTIQMRGGTANNITGFNTGFLVLDNSGNVLGISEAQVQTGNASWMTYNFTDINGNALILNSSDTYTFRSVKDTAIDLIKNSFGTDTDFTYSSSGSLTATGGTTISGINQNFGFGTDNSTSQNDLKVIGSSHSPIIKDIQFASIPEPTTATLSLLGLGALLLRRRRTV